MTHTRRTLAPQNAQHRCVPVAPLAEVLALGLANGLLLGAGLAAAHPAHALVVNMGAGTFITLTYLLMTRWRQA